jgi:MoaA/NifB/PqqE/SkfB family radical SAM enzyme
MSLSLREKIAVFLRSPFATLAGMGRNLLFKVRIPAQVEELRRITREAPLFLQIETINVCNASCIFCAYSGMERKQGVMNPELFRKVVQDYARMGGGPVCLTPIVGDALLDPHFLERLEILQRYPEVNQVTVTTNGIALERYSDQDLCRLLERLYCLQLSIGGLDPVTYQTMFGVDRFSQVMLGVERLLKLRNAVADPAYLSFAFRTNDRKFETRFKDRLDRYREQGVHVSHIWSYANYSGAVKEDEERNLVVYESRGKKRTRCVSPSMNMTVCWDGTITACGCADFQGDKLTIGHADKDSLAEAWSGKRRAAFLDSFAKGKLLPICRECSGYTPDTVFACPYFRGIRPHEALPLDFFRNVVT